ncbi:MAG TPA: hypothetical protein VFW28_08470 [Micropepsaceae bacterium]|nr:hypothetical protein [Micropepsaceae bacterium]
MGEHDERAIVCRNRAEELRQLAETMTSPEARDSLLKTATRYDRMAASEERLAKEIPDSNSSDGTR